MSKYEVFSGPYFPVFKLNTEIYPVNTRIQKYRKIRARKNSVFGHCSRGAITLPSTHTSIYIYAQIYLHTHACYSVKLTYKYTLADTYIHEDNPHIIFNRKSHL